MPISLSDSEMQIVLDHAKPIKAEDRSAYLQTVADELKKIPGAIGPGSVLRIAAQAQRQHMAAAAFTGHRGIGKHHW